MTEERDPLLESLFAEAQQDFDDDFVSTCMDSVRRRSRRVFASRVAIAVLVVAFELALDAPLKNSVGALASAMGTSLYEFDNEWLAFLMTPINSIAGLVGLLLLGLHALYRRIT
ncbi:MAG: hypothetical protein QNJ00_09810 [Woeseiaceae bacterium]|nr:hypothetical protein [Woeseiaceae bacterium]